MLDNYLILAMYALPVLAIFCLFDFLAWAFDWQ